MGEKHDISVPIPTTAGKFGKKDSKNEGNPFGFDETDVENYWCVVLFPVLYETLLVLKVVPSNLPLFTALSYNRALQDSADRLKSSFENLGPEGGYLATEKARDVLVRTGLEKDQLRQIWNLSDIDRDGLFDHDEYVVAMFLCDAVIQKGRPIPSELPTSVIPPRKRGLVEERKKSGF